MKAVGYLKSGSIELVDTLIDFDLPIPQPGSRDLRVKVAAISVNPVDTKVRKNRQPQAGKPEILGWDAVGIVDAAGADVHGFAVGDRVYYAGAINRSGSNAEYHLVDYRIVGHAPSSLSDTEAAALPLTTITAWELLFNRLGASEGGGDGQSLLIIGGAGGVGSILIQLARRLTKLTVIATASRPESQDWCRSLGAHEVIDHSQPFGEQLTKIGYPQTDLVACLTHIEQHWKSIIEVATPQGHIALIEDPATPLNLIDLKSKSLSLHWEMMFTRSLYETTDMAEQGQLLDRVADLVNRGEIRTTLNQVLSPINAQNLVKAHTLIESGKSLGKIVLSGF
jgi:zinc-binding alcohol dehydrogenase family protein